MSWQLQKVQAGFAVQFGMCMYRAVVFCLTRCEGQEHAGYQIAQFESDDVSEMIRLLRPQ